MSVLHVVVVKSVTNNIFPMKRDYKRRKNMNDYIADMATRIPTSKREYQQIERTFEERYDTQFNLYKQYAGRPDVENFHKNNFRMIDELKKQWYNLVDSVVDYSSLPY
jgi:hypothetical protein